MFEIKVAIWYAGVVALEWGDWLGRGVSDGRCAYAACV